jgi:hypothetical protein
MSQQMECLLAHATLPRLHLRNCRGGRLSVRCNALQELTIQVPLACACKSHYWICPTAQQEQKQHALCACNRLARSDGTVPANCTVGES